MKNRLLFLALSAAAVGITAGASRTAFGGSGQGVAVVRLQATSPGSAQTGNINITGDGQVSTLNAKYVRADTPDGNSIIGWARTTAGAYPAVVGVIPPGGLAGNAGVWGNNQIMGTSGLLAYGDVGVTGWAGTGPNSRAASFVGQVDVGGSKGNVIVSNVFGFNSVMNNIPVGVVIGAPADQAMGLFTNGVERIRIDPNGLVGVGTVAPSTFLDVTGNMGAGDAFNGGFVVQHSNQTQGIGMGYNTIYAAGTNGDQSLGLLAKGAGQINLNAMGGHTHIYGKAYVESGFGGAPSILFAVGDTDTGLNSVGDGSLNIMSNNIVAMYVRGGSVGMGTSSPAGKFHLVDANTSTTYVAASFFGANQNSASTHPGGNFWSGGVEATGNNGIIGGTSVAGGDGVVGIATAASGTGVYGFASLATGINYGVAGSTNSGTNGYGVFSFGRTGASGVKSFRIDHPQDPLNKYLLHYSAEGPQPLNIYQGHVTTDDNGYAWVQLPSYFEDINRDPEYVLTVTDDSDDFILSKVSKGVQNNRFQIRTSKGNIRVSWEVKAVRNDAWVQKYGAPVEMEKEGLERGRYQHPELYNAPADMGMNIQMNVRKGK